MSRLVEMFVDRKRFAVAPVRIHDGHRPAGVCVQHLLSADHFNLIGESIEFEFVGCNVVKLRVNVTQQIERPLIAGHVELLGHVATPSAQRRLLSSQTNHEIPDKYHGG